MALRMGRLSIPLDGKINLVGVEPQSRNALDVVFFGLNSKPPSFCNYLGDLPENLVACCSGNEFGLGK